MHRVFCVTVISTAISMTTPQQDPSISFIAATLREANFIILSLVIHCDGWCSMSLPYPLATHYKNEAYYHVLFLGNYFVNMRLIAMVTQSHQSVIVLYMILYLSINNAKCTISLIIGGIIFRSHNIGSLTPCWDLWIIFLEWTRVVIIFILFVLMPSLFIVRYP